MEDTPIPDRFKIGLSKEMVRGVIFGVEYLISATKTKMQGEMVFRVYVWRFGALSLMEPPIVRHGRYANLR